MEANGTALAKPAALAVMEMPPDDAALCEQIGNEMWIGLALRYEQIALPSEVNLLKKGPAGQNGKDYQLALRHFDEYVISQFAEWNCWPLLMSREVVRMVARWQVTDPELLERFGAALDLRSKIFRGEKPAPLLKDLDKFVDSSIVELQSLFRIMRDELLARKGPASRCDRIAAWMQSEIEGRPADFPNLFSHVLQLHGFVANYLPARNPKAAKLLETGGMRADSFFYLWYAASSNRSVKDVRNQVSILRRQNRSSLE